MHAIPRWLNLLCCPVATGDVKGVPPCHVYRVNTVMC